MLYPLRLAPVYFEKVWGDRRLERYMGRQIPAETPIGESWEVSDHPHGRSIVTNGPAAGQSLHALIERDPSAMLGARVYAQYGTRFPLLIKYLDADDKLSVQVHPNDAYAMEHEGELGKTEMWYILHADPGAQLIAGLQPGVTREQFGEALAGGDPSDLLHFLPVKTGDAVFIPSGRIHALLSGLLLLEIQQNSDTTYRLYDWGRLGLDGQPRALHVEQAMAVADWTDYAPNPQTERTVIAGANRKTVLATCPYFTVEKHDLASEAIFTTDGGSFYIINCVAGSGDLTWPGGTETLTFGDTLLIPAGLRDFALHPDGEASYLVSFVP